MRASRLAALLLPLALAAALACQVPGEEQIAQSIENVASVEHVSAEEIFFQYRADSGAADVRYKGNVVTITGIVTEIAVDVFGTPYIELRGGEFAGMSCRFTIGEAIGLASVVPGQEVTVKGVVEGMVINVVVRGCTFPQDE